MQDREPALFNRARLFEAVAAVLRRAKRTGRQSVLFMVSVNALSAVNTRLGIDIGDGLIVSVGRLLKSQLDDGDNIGRYGSNIFAILVEDVGVDDLKGVADSLMATVRDATIATAAGPMAASISVGAVVLPLHAQTATGAIQCALGALELAKLQPSGSFVAHDPAIAARSAKLREQALSSSVIDAIDQGRMLLVLQPIVDAKTRKVAFFEGLLRLRRSDGTLLPASDFIEEAEQLGVARQVDKRALELGMALLAAHPALTLSINISSLTVGDETWVATLERLTDARPDLRARLIVEMTETAMVHDFEAARFFLDRLRVLGCRVAIDDFGAGFTSFQHLRNLNVDILKIDGSFVADLGTDSQNQALVKAMVEMARVLGLQCVAEWVRDEKTADFLEAVGATHLQGFLYGQPMTVETLKQNGLL